MSAVVDTLRHEDFCLPRPGEYALRIESWRAPRYDGDGTRQTGSVAVVRCTECAVASYDGVQRD